MDLSANICQTDRQFVMGSLLSFNWLAYNSLSLSTGTLVLEKSAWNIIKDEYSLKYAGEEHFALWAANQNELYSNNENILTEEKFALITKRLTNIYSHPMLGRVSSTLRLANLVKVNKISNSNRWALIETASTRNYTKGWLETKDLLYINRSQFDRFKSDYPARLYYLSTQFNQ